MPVCIVSWCPNKTNSSSFNKNLSSLQKLIGGCITYHRFPRNEMKRKKWLEKLNMPELTQKQPLICSVHFNEDAFEKIGNKTFLRKNAVPNSLPVWSANNDLFEEENEKNLKNLSTTCFETEYPISVSDRIIEIQEYESMDSNMIEFPKFSEDINCQENKKKRCNVVNKEKSLKSTSYSIDKCVTSKYNYDEFLIENIKKASIMDHDYSISPILENSIPLESKHRSSSMSPERTCCYEQRKIFKTDHSSGPAIAQVPEMLMIKKEMDTDLPEVRILKKKMENENKKNEAIINNLRLQLQKQNEEIAYLKMKLSESDRLMNL